MSQISTHNFNPDTDPKLKCTCEHELCDERSINQESLDKFQLIRDDIGHSLTVTSGGRCPYHPNEIDKDEPGDHQKCTTLDIECEDDDTETKLKVLAGRHGATRVAGGAYCGFIHIAFTETDRVDVPTWGY